MAQGWAKEWGLMDRWVVKWVKWVVKWVKWAEWGQMVKWVKWDQMAKWVRWVQWVVKAK